MSHCTQYIVLAVRNGPSAVEKSLYYGATYDEDFLRIVRVTYIVYVYALYLVCVCAVHKRYKSYALVLVRKYKKNTSVYVHRQWLENGMPAHQSATRSEIFRMF